MVIQSIRNGGEVVKVFYILLDSKDSNDHRIEEGQSQL